MTKTKTFSLLLTENQELLLERLATQTDRSRGSVLRSLLTIAAKDPVVAVKILGRRQNLNPLQADENEAKND